MIRIFTGTVGSGKSYHAVELAIKKLKCFNRNYVIANFPIKFKKSEKKMKERFIYVEDDEVTVKNFIELAVKHGFVGKESSCLIILDEAGIYFNSRDWQQQKDRFLWIKFFAQSRKLGYDVVLVAQSLTMIDKQIRMCCEYNVKHIKLRNYIWFAWLPVQIFGAISFWSGGTFRGHLNFVMFKKWVANRYDTMRIFGQDEIATTLKELQAAPERPAGEAAGAERIKPDKVVSIKSKG
ncbi:MAG: zonular occludens toxin domain-containing protein [Natronincolaceae bacterium]